jgi:hypothetical protein
MVGWSESPTLTILLKSSRSASHPNSNGLRAIKGPALRKLPCGSTTTRLDSIGRITGESGRWSFLQSHQFSKRATAACRAVSSTAASPWLRGRVIFRSDLSAEF